MLHLKTSISYVTNCSQLEITTLHNRIHLNFHLHDEIEQYTKVFNTVWFHNFTACNIDAGYVACTNLMAGRTMRNSVFSSFSFNSLRDIHFLMSSMQSSMIRTASYVLWSVRKNSKKSWVPSAYRCAETPYSQWSLWLDLYSMRDHVGQYKNHGGNQK